MTNDVMYRYTVDHMVHDVHDVMLFVNVVLFLPGQPSTLVWLLSALSADQDIPSIFWAVLVHVNIYLLDARARVYVQYTVHAVYFVRHVILDARTG
jgi:hypothetical protein